MAINPSARLHENAGSVRPHGEPPTTREPSPELIEAANAALSKVITGTSPPFGRMKPVHPATSESSTRHPALRTTWERLRPNHILLGSVILAVAVFAAVIAIVLTPTPGDSGAVAVARATAIQPAAAAPSVAASGAAIAAPSVAATSAAAPVPPIAVANVVSSEPLVPAMPALAAGFYNAWYVTPGQDCAAVVGSYRPQELVENANPGLSTGARCSNLTAGTFLCRDSIDRGMTGTPACLGAIRVTAGLVFVWGALPSATPPVATVSLGQRSATGAQVNEPIATLPVTAARGACLVALPAVPGEIAVLRVEGVASPLIVDLGTIARDMDAVAVPACG